MLVIVAAFAFTGCDDDDETTDGDADGDSDGDGDGDGDADGDSDADEEEEPLVGCNPIADEWNCLLPYPSDFFLNTEGGERLVDLPDDAVLHDEYGQAFDVLSPWEFDGFSVSPHIIALFPSGVDDSDLPFFMDEPEVSTGDGSPTILLAADTGERVAHFAEIDPRPEDVEDRSLVIHPLAPLDFDTRYIVAVRNLQTPDGGAIEPPSGFAALRDGTVGDDGDLADLVDHYEDDIFPALTDAGIARDTLQLAWDFTTVTRENVTGDMLRAREVAIEALEATPPVIRIDEGGVTEPDHEYIARRIAGTLEVPLVVENDQPGAWLHRDDDGQVALNGTAEAAFTIYIPRSVMDSADARPARILQFGHGFFGSRAEAEEGFLPEFADRAGLVVVAIDWWGMSAPDRDEVVVPDVVTDTNNGMRFTDRSHQGIINQIALAHAIRTTLAEEESLMIDDVLAYDPEHIYFYGISMGHILGGTYLALAPDVERAALSVGGGPFSLIMFRSTSFQPLFFVVELLIKDFVDHQKFASFTQSALDRIDPMTYASFLTGEPIPGNPADLPILLHDGLGDTQVPNVATHTHARALGATLLEPAVRPIPGIPSAEGPLTGRVIAEWDFGIEEPLPGTYAEFWPENNIVHFAVREHPASMDQIDAFFQPEGEVTNHCDGICDPD